MRYQHKTNANSASRACQAEPVVRVAARRSPHSSAAGAVLHFRVSAPQEEDDEYKLVLPAQRISLPAVSTRIKQIIGGVFVLLVLRVVRGIVIERRRG